MTFLPFLLFVAQVPASAPPPEKVVAKISGQDVHASELAPYLWDWYAQLALQEYVIAKLISDEADKRKVTVTEKEIQDAVQKRLLQIQQSMPAGQDLDAALRNQGMPKSRLAIEAKYQLQAEKIAALDFHPEEYVKASTMVVKPKSSSATDLKTALDKATNAYNKLKGGAKWDDVMKATVEDPNLVQNGGKLDWNAISAFPVNTQKDLKSLATGGYAAPVQTEFGIQIFRVDLKGQDAKGADLDNLKSRAVPRIEQTLVQKLRTDAKIQIMP